MGKEEQERDRSGQWTGGTATRSTSDGDSWWWRGAGGAGAMAAEQGILAAAMPTDGRRRARGAGGRRRPRANGGRREEGAEDFRKKVIVQRGATLAPTSGPHC